MKYGVIWLFLLFNFCNPLFGQQQIELSTRYQPKTQAPVTNMPPAIFLSYKEHINKYFLFGVETHLDVGTQQKIWPGIGQYKIREKRFGFGLLLTTTVRLSNRFCLRTTASAGFLDYTRKLQNSNPMIEKYVIPPPDDKVSLYSHFSIGVLGKITKSIG